MTVWSAVLTGAQDLEVRITVDDHRPWTAHVAGDVKGVEPTKLSFLQNYAGINFPEQRISGVKTSTRDRRDIACRRGTAWDYACEANFASFEYDVSISPGINMGASAHTSWLTPFGGILVLDDLLPQPTDRRRAGVTLELPPGWRILSDSDRVNASTIDVAEAQRVVILVGPGWSVTPVGDTQLKLAIFGDPQVSASTAGADVDAIYNAYVKLFGSTSTGHAAQIALVRPPNSSGGAWDAETRGSNVTIISSGGLSPADAEQRLEQQLRHELFHLWFPNGVDLSGNYDWFYEGFAVYEASKIGVAMNQIRFEDFLSTLGRAYDIDRFTAKRSLIDASQNRWVGASSQVYARGMLVAFLCDLALLDASKGKTSVESLERQVFETYKPPAAAAIGNDAVIAIMRSHPELVGIVDNYVTGAKAIDWESDLQKGGIRPTTRAQLTQLAVAEKLNGRQKALLDKLGYNNWRKLAPK